MDSIIDQEVCLKYQIKIFRSLYLFLLKFHTITYAEMVLTPNGTLSDLGSNQPHQRLRGLSPKHVSDDQRTFQNSFTSSIQHAAHLFILS
jgi:hypothetical protein